MQEKRFLQVADFDSEIILKIIRELDQILGKHSGHILFVSLAVLVLWIKLLRKQPVNFIYNFLVVHSGLVKVDAQEHDVAILFIDHRLELTKVPIVAILSHL
jgi:hypothetical protein